MPMEQHRCVAELLKGKLKELNIDLTKTKRTVFAAIIAHDLKLDTYDIISIGSGLKCLPDKVVAAHPDALVHDMHAEIVCKRAFHSFLYQQLIDVICEKKSNNYICFDQKMKIYLWNPEIHLLLFTSKSPCNFKIF